MKAEEGDDEVETLILLIYELHDRFLLKQVVDMHGWMIRVMLSVLMLIL